MKLHKKITFGLLALTLVGPMTSCSDFLDEELTTQQNTDFFDTQEGIDRLEVSLYYNLRFHFSKEWACATTNYGTDEFRVGGDGSNASWNNYDGNFQSSIVSNSTNMYEVWDGMYIGINNANLLLSKVTPDSYKEANKNTYMGEAYFLRAHYYYILVRLYGGVPLRLEPFEPGESADIARNTVDEVYAQILSDCKNAVNMLPPKSSYGDADRGRACKEAAMAMLADIYLTLAPNHRDYYNEVVTLCNNIAAMGYDLTQCNYADNFNATINNGAESLFEVQYSGSTEYDFWGGDNQASWLSTFMGPRNSGMVAGAYGWNLPTEEFVKQYEDGDLRKDITVLYQGCPAFDGMEYKRSWSNTGYNVRKFLVSKTVSPEYNTNPNNFVVYRYADVLLKKAEALNEQGHPDQAAEPLNIVRKRAGLTELPTTLTQTEMREKIIHERRMELAFEGHRWFDMIRVDNGNYALTFLKSIGKNNVTKERLLLPIPQTEMDSNHLMTQNPGY